MYRMGITDTSRGRGRSPLTDPLTSVAGPDRERGPAREVNLEPTLDPSGEQSTEGVSRFGLVCIPEPVVTIHPSGICSRR